jgi:general secretion pathway protein H
MSNTEPMLKARPMRGFTLLEIMLVLVLLSLGSVTVVMSLPDSQQDLAQEQAERFYHRLQLLNEDAILNGRDLGIRFEEADKNYAFVQLTGKGWQLYESKHFSENSLPDGLQLQFELGSSAWHDNESMLNQESLFDDEMFSELEEEKTVKPPQVFVLGSGEITPFSLSILPKERAKAAQRWQVLVKESGVIRLLEPGEDDEESP